MSESTSSCIKVSDAQICPCCYSPKIIKNGQLTTKMVGRNPSDPLQEVDYHYNIRGWLTHINNVDALGDNLFAFKINYNTVDDWYGMPQPLFNGNISETFWRTQTDNELRKYGYVYDGLNRLKDAYYQKIKNQQTIYTNSYNEHIQYDKNGNITSIGRTGDIDSEAFYIKIDDLSYFYDDGNKLLQVKDATNHPEGFRDGANNEQEYGYDDLGNMIRDDNKKIKRITYNHLNLPKEILFDGTPTQKINYLYNAVGQKVEKTITKGSSARITSYQSGFHYESEVLKFFATAEGYVTYNAEDKKFKYIYNYTDHLGNIRVSYTADDNINLPPIMIEENHYYPFGLKHKKYGMADAVPALAYQYKYNGKEFQDELGLNWYSYGFRMYDPALGRFPSMDPISDQFPHVSPYNYAENEPVSSIDLWGLQRWRVNGRERNSAMPEWRTDARAAGFAMRHPVAASRIGTVERGGTNISSVAGRFARHYAESTGTSKDIGSQSNAVRHGLWAAMIRTDFSRGITQRATNAHEGVGIAETQEVDMSQPFTGKGQAGLNLADHIVDVLNNEIGMSIAEANPNASTKDLATLVLGEFKNNGLWTATTDKDGNVNISRTKITNQQYKTALNMFNSLDSNGFTKEEKQALDKEREEFINNYQGAP